MFVFGGLVSGEYIRTCATLGGWGSGRADLDSGSFLASSSCSLVRDSGVHLKCLLA